MTQKATDAGTSTRSIDSYKGLDGLPTLVGLHSMREVVSTGLTVNQSVGRLKRIHWSLNRLHQIFVSRITSVPIYELKMAFSLHAHYCVEHAGEFAMRVREMRQPPYGLEVCPHDSLDMFFDEILSAPSTEMLISGLSECAVPALVRALEHLMADTNKLFDHPTWRICRLTLIEIQDIQQYGIEAARCLVKDEQRAEFREWLVLLDRMLAAAGDLDGKAGTTGEVLARRTSAAPYTYDPVPQRDARFNDPYNMGVNAEAMLFDPDMRRCPRRSCSTSSACAKSTCLK